MSYWFTSDYHLGHANIIEYCDRPFKDLDTMNETIIRNHNARVKPSDTVFFIGDFCFHNSSGGKVGEGGLTKSQEYIDRLNGNIVFIKGNHDKNNSLNTCLSSGVINLGGYDIFLTHRPEDYNHRYKINLVGHVHKDWKSKGMKNNVVLINVGVDVWGFKPISIQEILKELNSVRNKE